MIDGLDAALEGMKVGESKTFNTQLVGMKEGDTGEVTVTLQAVKKRGRKPFSNPSSDFD